MIVRDSEEKIILYNNIIMMQKTQKREKVKRGMIMNQGKILLIMALAYRACVTSLALHKARHLVGIKPCGLYLVVCIIYERSLSMLAR